MNKLYGIIGLARKGGKIILGYDTTVSYIKGNSSDVLVLIAEDASEKTKKNIIFQCERFSREYLVIGEKSLYGKMLNKKEVSVLLVLDKNIIAYIKGIS